MSSAFIKVSSPLLGLIGGLSYHSTLTYYQRLNEGYADCFGKDRSAPLLIFSHDFGIIGRAQASGNWKAVEEAIVGSARVLAKGGCQRLLIASNTIHKFFHSAEAQSKIPVLHIGDAVGKALKNHGCQRVGLLGTRPTMEEAFLKARIEAASNVEIRIPTASSREDIHRLIWERLVRGAVDDDNRRWFQDFCEAWVAEQRLDSIVLSCTELGLLNCQPRGFALFDSLEEHVQSGLSFLCESH